MYGGQHDTISDALCIGDTFATNANEDGAGFYLLRCSEEKYKTARALSDSWGNILFAGSYLVEGYYYELVEGAEHVYYMPASQPKVLLASHLIRPGAEEEDSQEGPMIVALRRSRGEDGGRQGCFFPDREQMEDRRAQPWDERAVGSLQRCPGYVG
ncbi:hypothetical protein L7F22_065427 [Adiantum nelumboides]|nr:hypothetical protein [Adiantum nelumboides]